MQNLLRKPVFLLVVVSILVYANTLFNGYVLDDLTVIKEHAYVAKGIKGISDILSTPYLKGFRESHDANDKNDVYRPLSLITFAAERSAFGEVPLWSHLIQVLLFAASAALLFFFLDGLFDHKKTALAFIAALLFALHPIHTEVVANLKSRDELLCFFWALCALLLFARYAASGRWLSIAAGALCYFLSLLSKETSISFVLIFPLVFFFYRNQDKKRSVYISVAACIAAAIYLIIRHMVLANNHAEYTGEIKMIDNALAGAPSLASRMATAVLIMGYYIRLLFIPYPLVSEYGFNAIPFATFGNVWVIASLLGYVSLAVVAVLRLLKKKADPYAFGILFYLLTIALFSNILFLIGSTLGERFLFFPSVGFCVCVAALVCHVTTKEVYGNLSSLPRKAWIFVISAGIIFSVLTIMRNAEWKDNYTLLSSDASKSPNCARLWHSLGYELSTTVLDDEPDIVKKREIIREAITDMQHAVAIYPAYGKAHFDLANVFNRVQLYDSAEAHFKAAIAIDTDNVPAISALGYVYFLKGEYQKTIDRCRQALRLEPKNVTVLNNMGICYLQLHQYDSATAISKRALDIEPGNQLAASNLATAGRLQQAGDTVKR